MRICTRFVVDSHAKIRLQRTTADQRSRVEAKFALEDLELHRSAQVVLESGFKDFAQRFPWGTVESLGPESDPVLMTVSSDQRPFFRVEVVDPSNHQLLALARRLYLISDDGDDGGRRELFRVRTEPLGQELWRVVIKEDGAPILDLNKDVPDVLARFREPNFRAAILPAAMRTVLLALRDDEEDQDDDPDSWAQRWFRFAGGLAGYDRPGSDDPDGIRNWIDRACNLFAECFRLVSDMIAAAERRNEP